MFINFFLLIPRCNFLAVCFLLIFHFLPSLISIGREAQIFLFLSLFYGLSLSCMSALKAPKALFSCLFFFHLKGRQWCVQITSHQTHYSAKDCRMCARGKIRVKKFVNNFNGYSEGERERERVKRDANFFHYKMRA